MIKQKLPLEEQLSRVDFELNFFPSPEIPQILMVVRQAGGHSTKSRLGCGYRSFCYHFLCTILKVSPHKDFRILFLPTMSVEQEVSLSMLVWLVHCACTQALQIKVNISVYKVWHMHIDLFVMFLVLKIFIQYKME